MSAYERFLASMVLDYEKWHDGIGYDLSALDEMSEEDRQQIAARLRAKNDDWRDLEALDYLKAHEGILESRRSDNPEHRLIAMRYGPEPDGADLEDAILAGLQKGSVLGRAVDQAALHPTPRIREALLALVRDCDDGDAYAPAAALFFLHGIIDSPHSWDERPFLLRLVEPESEDRREAFREFCERLGV